MDNISTSEIIYNLLAKYNLKETDEELAKKYFGEKASETNGEIIFWIIIKLARGQIAEKDLDPFLKERLKISQEIANQLKGDLVKDLLPIMKIDPKKQRNQPIAEKTPTEEKENILAKIKRPIEVEKALSKPRTAKKQVVEENTERKKEEIKKLPKVPLINSINEPSEKDIKPKSNDSYREPI